MRGYLTPNSIPTDSICRILFIPNNQEFIANVTGAIEELTFPENWTPFGTLTPDQSAAALIDMFDKFCFNQGVCRVVGEFIDFAGSSSPDPKWLECDGSSLLRADYPDLFAVIGTIYGSMDGTHFNLPDSRGRDRIGSGTGPGLSPRAVGDSFGEENHQLTTSELANHVHDGIPTFTATAAGLEVTFASLVVPLITTTTTSTGGDTPHNNMQPSLAALVLIVALP